MSRLVFGPKTSGINVGPIHIGVTVSVFQDAGAPPDCFTLVATSPLGNTTKMTVSNGASKMLEIVPGELSTTISTVDWTPNLPGAPTMCSIKVVIRAEGHVRIPPLPMSVPVSIQVDAYDVVLHRSIGDFAAFIDASSASVPAGATLLG